MKGVIKIFPDQIQAVGLTSDRYDERAVSQVVDGHEKWVAVQEFDESGNAVAPPIPDKATRAIMRQAATRLAALAKEPHKAKAKPKAPAGG